MKIANETKVGAFTIICVVLLILGFNFLKGKSLFQNGFVLYAKYENTRKLLPSNPVYVNGFQVGSVYQTFASGDNLQEIIVSIKFNEEYDIPDNSIASIESSPLGSPSISITLGDSKTYHNAEDTLISSNSADMLSNIGSKLAPVADKLAMTLTSLDSLLRNVNTLLDPNTKNNLQSVIGNLNRSSANIVASTNSLQTLLDMQSGALALSLNNMSDFTKNLSANNGKINNIMSNLDSTTAHLAQADVKGIVTQLKSSVDSLSLVINTINSTDGTLGALINDRGLYNKINNTVVSLNTLADDLRVHPNRYVNISVFGRKDKGNYLANPLITDTTYLPEPAKDIDIKIKNPVIIDPTMVPKTDTIQQ